VNDNYFADAAIRRFSIVEEDEAAVVNLVSD
jgi:D-lyxose ketol-isomerase